MVVFTKKEELIKHLSPLRKTGNIGFVPTMGALHKGHLSLVERALGENETVVVSIFVNPTQFDNTADLKKYPRNPEADLEILTNANKDVIAYFPKVSEVYGKSPKSKKYRFDGLENQMEGKHRPGHFNGVGTILEILFKIVEPNAAYFGEKDFQQLQIVKILVISQKLPVKIVGCPIVREKNGLAMSSRNKRLTPEEFNKAALIFETLCDVKEKIDALSLEKLHTLVTERFLQNSNLELEYFEIAEENSLETAHNIKEGVKYRAFIAAFLGEIRLIDNMSLN